MAVSYGLLDGKAVTVLVALKLYRIMTLWIVLYVLDKVYQAKYVSAVFVAHRAPPRLLYLPFVMVAVEGMTFMLAFAVLLVFERRFKRDQNTFIVDETLLWQVMVDYLITTICIFAIGLVVVYAVTNCSVLRYKHDGLRGIRAGTRLIFYLACVIIALPCYLAY